MQKLLMVFVMILLPVAAFAGPKPGIETAKRFGGEILSDQSTSLGDVISNFDKYDGKTVRFEATAKKVCEAKGCWMVLKDSNSEVRTLFKDYGFFVPKTILGKKVRVQGVMKRKKVSAATLRHFKKDEGAKLEEIKKIKTGKIQFEFEADAVEII